MFKGDLQDTQCSNPAKATWAQHTINMKTVCLSVYDQCGEGYQPSPRKLNSH